MRGRRLRQIEDNQAPSKQGRALRILIGLALAANLLAGTANALTANAPGEAAPPNLRAIITANLQRPDLDPTVPAAYSGAVPGEVAIFPAGRRVSEVEISDAARRTLTMLHGWAWQTCLRAMVNGSRTTLAIFVAQNRVIDVRTALIADRCDQGNYSALPVKRPAPRPSTQAKKSKTANKPGEVKKPKP